MTNRIKQQLERYEATFDNMLRYNTRCLLFVSGSPGVGKSFTAQKVAARYKIRPQPIVATNVHAFNGELYRHRNAPLIIMDDADQLLTQRDAANIVKGAFGPDRRVSLPTKRSQKAKVLKDICPGDPFVALEPTPQYDVRTKLVWITNVDVTAHIAEKMSPDLKPVWEALLSRSGEPINIRGTRDDVYRYALYLAEQGDLFKFRKDRVNKMIRGDIAPTAAKEARQWFTDNRDRLNEVTPRMLWTLACLAHNLLDDNVAQVDRFKEYATFAIATDKH